MVDIIPAPRIIKDIYLSIGTNTFQKAVSDAHITSPAPITWQGGESAAIYGDIPSGGEVLNLTAVQDWETVDSLCLYLRTNKGTKATVIFSPRSAGTAYFQCDVILSAPQIGGPVNQFGEFTLALPVVSEVESVAAPV